MSIGDAAEFLGVHIDTLRRWDEAGKLVAEKSPKGTRRYRLSALRKMAGVPSNKYENVAAIMADSDPKVAEVRDIAQEFIGNGSLSGPESYSAAQQYLRVNTSPIVNSADRTGDQKNSWWQKISQKLFKRAAGLALAAVLSFLFISAALAALPIGLYLGQSLPKDGRGGSLLGSNQLQDVLAESVIDAKRELVINADTTINGTLTARGLNITGDAQLNVTNNAQIDQDLTSSSTPTFAALTLTNTSQQISSGNNVLTIDASGSIVTTTATQTLTNKTLDGSANTFKNIANSALANSKITINTSGLLSGGGDVALGSSISLSVAADTDPSYETVTLTAASSQLVFGTGAGILTWSPSSAKTVTIPDQTGTVCLTTGNCSGIGGVVGGSGTQNYLAKWNNSGGTNIGSSVIYDDGTNVGIGSATPAYKLDVVGTLQVTGSGFTGLRLPTGASANYMLTTDGSGNASWTNPTGSGSFGAWTLSGSTVYPNQSSYNLLLGSTSVLDDTAKFRVLGSSGILPVASISGSTSKAALFVDNTVGDLFTASSSGLSRFVITQNGNVGIGTSVPAHKLHVSGNAFLGGYHATLALYSNGSTDVSPGNYLSGFVNGYGPLSADIGMHIYGYGGLSFNTDAAARLSILQTGNIGINTTGPTSLLDVRGFSGTNTYSGIASVASISGRTAFATMVVDNSGVGDLFTASSSGLSRFVITQNGNVGIGTVTPGYSLEAKATSYGAEKVTNGSFTGSATGWTVGSWLYNNNAIDSNGAWGYLQQNVSAVAGELYKVTYTVSNYSSGSLVVYVGGATGTAARSANGTYTDYIKAVSTGNLLLYPTGGTMTVDDVSVVKVVGGVIASEGGAVLTGTVTALAGGYAYPGYGFTGAPYGIGMFKDSDSALGFSLGNCGTCSLSLYGHTGSSWYTFATDTVQETFTSAHNLNFKAYANSSRPAFQFNSPSAITATSGNQFLVGIGVYYTGSATFAPTSGTATFTAFDVSPTINQTGGASGLSRGVYVNPTLTSAADFRAIETTNGRTILKSTLGTVPTASISAQSSFASLLVDNTVGDLFTASSSGLSRFVITQNGNVGIGTSSPASGYKLNVRQSPGVTSDGVRISGDSSTLDLYTHIGSSYLTASGHLNVSSGAYLYLQNQMATLDDNGMGIGTAPVGKLIVSGKRTGKANTILNETGDQAVFTASVSGVTKFIIANDGNVGVGTTNPAAFLEVSNSSSATIFKASGYSPQGNYVSIDGYAQMTQYLGDTGGVRTNSFLTAGGSSLAQVFDAYQDQFMFQVGSVYGRQFILSDVLGYPDFGHDSRTDPTLYIHSATNPTSDSTQWLGLWHDQTDANIQSGKGKINLTPATNVVVTSGNVGIGSISPGQKLDITGSARVSGSYYVSNGDSIDSYGGWLRINSGGYGMIVDSAYAGLKANSSLGGFGLSGLQSVNADSSVYSNFGAASLVLTGYGNSSLPIATISGATARAALLVDNSVGDLFTASSSGLSRFVITNLGNVGIGTSSPGYSTEISGRSTGSNLLRVGQAKVGDWYTGSYAMFVNQALTGNSDFALVQNSGGATYLNSASGNSINFGIGANYYMALNSSGNLGIGTTSPSSLLNVVHTGTTTNGGVFTGNGLSTGNLLSLTSTSIAQTSGKLLNIDFSPGGATTYTGNLVNINVGGMATISGQIFNIQNNGSDIFSVNQTVLTSNLPANFTSPGDVGIAYDLGFTNPVSSYITSNAPLYIAAGKIYNSSNLVLSTYNVGNVIADSQAFVANYAATVSGQLVLGTTTPTYTPSQFGKLYVEDSQNSTASAVIYNSHTSGATLLSMKTADTTPTGTYFIELLDGSGKRIGAAKATSDTVATWQSGGIDLAEYFVVDSGLSPTDFSAGQLVCQGVNGVRPCTPGEEAKIIGAISTAPAFLGGIEGSNKVIVGLLGQIPVTVAQNSPSVSAGDYLTVSAGGKAKKAVSSGFVLGKALSSLVSPDGHSSVMVLIQPGWVEINNQLLEFDQSLTSGSGWVNLATMSAEIATITETLRVIGSSQLGNTSIGGTLDVGLLHFDDLLADLSSTTGELSLQHGVVKVRENGEVAGTSVIRGVLTLSAEDGATVSAQSWSSVPVSIIVTPSFETTAWVEGLSKDGFTLRVSPAPTSAQKIYWQALW